MDEKRQWVMQSLATINNYISTGRLNKAVESLHVIDQVDRGNQLAQDMMVRLYCMQNSMEYTDHAEFFGQHWLGEDLNGKSIEIFCDQGMGDTIQLLRYVKLLKERYDCRIVLNNYAFFNEFEALMVGQSYIDKFTPFHEKCDFHSNIMSIPALLNGITLGVYYPAHFAELLQKEIPPPIDFGIEHIGGKDFMIGLAWKSNTQNPLSKIKSIPIEKFEFLKDFNVFSLLPETDAEWLYKTKIETLHDTAHTMSVLEAVVSVDTVSLHLAGSLGIPAYGLIPHDADPRWEKGETTVWYPSVKLYHQSEDGNWDVALQSIKVDLESKKERFYNTATD